MTVKERYDMVIDKRKELEKEVYCPGLLVSFSGVFFYYGISIHPVRILSNSFTPVDYTVLMH